MNVDGRFEYANLATFLGDPPLLNRQGAKASILERTTNSLQERPFALAASTLYRVIRSIPAVREPLLLLTRNQCHLEGGRVANEVPKIAEPVVLVGL